MGINEEVRTVTDPASVAGDTNPSPEGGQDGRAEGGDKEENRIPQSRVEEMWAKREAKLREEWVKKELDPVRQRYEADQQRMTNAEIARLKAMGWIQDEAPKPVTQDQLEKMLTERLEKARTEEREERLQLYYSQQIESGWREVSRKYPALASKRTFQSAVLALYAENPQVDFVSIADEAAKDYEAYRADRETEANRERDGRRSPDRRVVPGGRGAAGGSGEKTGKKQTVGQKLLAHIRAAKEGTE